MVTRVLVLVVLSLAAVFMFCACSVSLDEEVETCGVKASYPSSWEVQDASTTSKELVPSEGGSLEISSITDTFAPVDDKNVGYVEGFTAAARAYCDDSEEFSIDESSSQVDLKENAMTFVAPATSTVNDVECIGYAVIAYEGDSEVARVLILLPSDKKNSADLAQRILDTVEFTCPSFVYDPNGSVATSIAAAYNGDTEEGAAIDGASKDITVTATCEDKSTYEAIGWHSDDSITLEAGKTSKMAITYQGMSTDLEIKCTTSPIKELKASYSGDTEEGAVLNDSNDGIKVVKVRENGEEVSAKGWKIEKPATLKAGESSTVKITCDGMSTDLTVKCTTESPQQYRDSCKTPDYKDLLRNPDDHSGDRVKFRGEVNQVMGDGFRMYVTQGAYGSWYEDDIIVYWEGSPTVIEDDVVTIYGTAAGNYEYETVMGAKRTVPLISAEYVDLD